MLPPPPRLKRVRLRDRTRIQSIRKLHRTHLIHRTEKGQSGFRLWKLVLPNNPFSPTPSKRTSSPQHPHSSRPSRPRSSSMARLHLGTSSISTPASYQRAHPPPPPPSHLPHPHITRHLPRAHQHHRTLAVRIPSGPRLQSPNHHPRQLRRLMWIFLSLRPLKSPRQPRK